MLKKRQLTSQINIQSNIKKLSIYTTLALTTLSLTNPVFANKNATQLDKNSPHSVGFQAGAGNMEYKNADAKYNIIGTSYLYYNYQFANNLYLEVGLSGAADAEDWQCERDAQNAWDCTNKNNKNLTVTADSFEYNAYVLALKGNIALSERNSLYGKIGANFYDYKLELKREKTADESGTGVFFEAGWEYRWDNNIGMNIGIKAESAGDVEIASTNIGISYQF